MVLFKCKVFQYSATFISEIKSLDTNRFDPNLLVHVQSQQEKQNIVNSVQIS